jgi:hypothetical protein
MGSPVAANRPSRFAASSPAVLPPEAAGLPVDDTFSYLMLLGRWVMRRGHGEHLQLAHWVAWGRAGLADICSCINVLGWWGGLVDTCSLLTVLVAWC